MRGASLIMGVVVCAVVSCTVGQATGVEVRSLIPLDEPRTYR